MLLIKTQIEKAQEFFFLGIFLSLPFLDILSPIFLVGAILLGAFSYKKHSILESLGDNKVNLLLITYFILCFLSLTTTSNYGQTGERILKNIVYVLMPFAFVLTKPDELLIKKAKKLFLYATIAFCLFSLLKLGYNYATRFDESHWYNFIQTSMYHKYIPEDAMQINTALTILLLGKFSKNVKLFIALLFLIILVLFGVRLGLAIYLLIIGVYFTQNIKLFLNLRTLLIVIGATIFSFFLIENSRYVNDKFYDTLEKIGFDTKSRVSETGEEYHNIRLREVFWSSSIDLIKEKPLLGHGGGMGKRLLDKEYEKKGLKYRSFNAHNQFLSSFIQYGILGPIIILAIFTLLFVKAIMQKNQLVITILCIMILSMITESYLEIQQGLFYFCIFSCFLFYLLKYEIKQ